MPAQPWRGPLLPGPGQPAGVRRVPRRSGRRWLGRGSGHSPGRPESSAVIKRHLLVPLAALSGVLFRACTWAGHPPPAVRGGGGGSVCGERIPRAQAALPLVGRLCRVPRSSRRPLGSPPQARGAAADGPGLLGPACLCLERGPGGGACTYVHVHGCVVLTAWGERRVLHRSTSVCLCVPFQQEPRPAPSRQAPAFGFLWEKHVCGSVQTPCSVSL